MNPATPAKPRLFKQGSLWCCTGLHPHGCLLSFRIAGPGLRTAFGFSPAMAYREWLQ